LRYRRVRSLSRISRSGFSGPNARSPTSRARLKHSSASAKLPPSCLTVPSRMSAASSDCGSVASRRTKSAGAAGLVGTGEYAAGSNPRSSPGAESAIQSSPAALTDRGGYRPGPAQWRADRTFAPRTRGASRGPYVLGCYRGAGRAPGVLAMQHYAIALRRRNTDERKKRLTNHGQPCPSAWLDIGLAYGFRSISGSARLDRGGRGGTSSSSLGSQVGPHLRTRLAMRHHSATWLSLALIQLTGTGASRRFSPLLAKQSQPLLYSDATAPRVPVCERRSPSTRCSIRKTAFSTGERLSILRRSIDDGCTIHTSQARPRASRKVR